MRIVIFSDVHANLLAYNAFLSDLGKRKFDAVYCLGDLVGYHIWPNEVIEKTRKRRFQCLKGNHEDNAFSYKQLTNKPLIENFDYEMISDENIQFLASLPSTICLNQNTFDSKISTLLVHGSPNSNKEYLLENTEDEVYRELFIKQNVEIICCGHSHKPFHKVVKVDEKFCHVINVGSVGKPKDGNPESCYVILEINENSTLNNHEGISVEFFRVKYNVLKASKELISSPLSNELADRLLKAY